jgi:ATP:corrinoid adenosyltransferase
MRTFSTGATRDNDEMKIDYEGFLSPLVLERYGRYLSKHRVQADGKLRDSDNWQKGIPKTAYMKSAWRHFLNMWKSHRYEVVRTDEMNEAFEDSICAVLFNVMGYLHETLREKR